MASPRPERTAEFRAKLRRGAIIAVKYGLVAVIAAGGAYTAAQYKLSNKMSEKLERRAVAHHGVVHREVTFLAGQVQELRKRVELATGNAHPDALFDSEPPSPGSIGREEIRDEFAPLRREVLDLSIALNQPDTALEERPAARRLPYAITDAPTALEVAIEQPVRNRFVTIHNLGDEVVDNPRLSVNGGKQWSSTADIVDEVVDDTMSDREKAFAIWSFLRDNRYHDASPHRDIESHDPVRYLSVYGYGLCDDSATVFRILAEQAGLKARVWSLNGHVVPEVFFEDGWRMLDPHLHVYYLEDDGYNVASVETLQERPDIIRENANAEHRSRTEKMLRVYGTADDNYVNDWYRDTAEAVHRIEFNLRPGESIYRSWDNWGLYFANRSFEQPKRYGNGRFVYRPPLRDELYRKGNHTEGLTLNAESAKPALVPDGDTDGVWIIPVQSPYPLLSGKVEIAGAVGDQGALTVQFSEDGDRWREIGHVDQRGAVALDLSTQPYFRNGHDRPMYGYQLKLTLRGSASIEQLQLESDFQHAPHALPELEKGINRVRYSDESADREVQIEFGYDPGQPGTWPSG